MVLVHQNLCSFTYKVYSVYLNSLKSLNSYQLSLLSLFWISHKLIGMRLQMWFILWQVALLWAFEIKYAIYSQNTVIWETQHRHPHPKGDKQKGGEWGFPGKVSNIIRQAAINLNSSENLWLVSFAFQVHWGRGLAFWPHQDGNSAPEGWLCRFGLSELWEALPRQLCSVPQLSRLDSCACTLLRWKRADGYTDLKASPSLWPRWGLS